jgi:hypothetical protein
MEEMRMSPDYGPPDTFTHKPTFLTVDELAKILRVNRNTLYAAIARARSPASTTSAEPSGSIGTR